MPGTF